MKRTQGRGPHHLRTVSLETGVAPYAEGSCIIAANAYSLTVVPGTYTYALSLTDYALTVTNPASGEIAVGTRQVLLRDHRRDVGADPSHCNPP